jgi:hypothetical protein
MLDPNGLGTVPPKFNPLEYVNLETQEVDVSRLLEDHPYWVAKAVLTPMFLEIVHREMEQKNSQGVMKYKHGETVIVEGADPQVTLSNYHCTTLVDNSAYLAGFEVPRRNSGRWEGSRDTLNALPDLQNKGLVQIVVPRGGPADSADEVDSIRPGDVLIWSPRSVIGEAFGHQMVITDIDQDNMTANVLEAGTSVGHAIGRPIRPLQRDSAVYRFVAPDRARVDESYQTDAEYRMMFNEAFFSASGIYSEPK